MPNIRNEIFRCRLSTESSNFLNNTEEFWEYIIWGYREMIQTLNRNIRSCAQFRDEHRFAKDSCGSFRFESSWKIRETSPLISYRFAVSENYEIIFQLEMIVAPRYFERETSSKNISQRIRESITGIKRRAFSVYSKAIYF